MAQTAADWPDDADGDVFRRLAAAGFDFGKAWTVDYNVDFHSWPPARAALDLLEAMFGELALYAPGEDGPGYVLFQVVGPVTYERVTSVQRDATTAMGPFGGTCESWGILH